MAAGRAAGDGDVVGVAAVRRDVLADPVDRLLHVDGLGRPRVSRREPVVDRHADPALGGQVLHQRDALLLLLAEDPRAAVHLQQHRGVLDRLLGQVDVEVVAPAGLAERDVPLDPDRDRRPAEGPERVHERPPRRPHLGRGRQRVELLAVVGAERLGQRGLGGQPVAPGQVDQVAEPGGGGAGDRERDRVATFPGQMGGGVGGGDGEPVRRQLTGDPAREERRDARAEAGQRADGVGGQGGVDEGPGPEGGKERHASNLPAGHFTQQGL